MVLQSAPVSPGSLHQRAWSRVLHGVMHAFDEPSHGEPSGEAQFVAEHVIDELEDLLVELHATLAGQPSAAGAVEGARR